jgi:hypothetical protein
MPATKPRRPPIDEKLAAQLRDYKGQWVAVSPDRNEVVASGKSAKEALDAAVKGGVTDPLIFRVSAHPERLNLF